MSFATTIETLYVLLTTFTLKPDCGTALVEGCVALVPFFFTACGVSDVLPVGCGPTATLPFSADVSRLPCLL